MKPTILLLSTYPFATPRHGGQVRLSNIASVFRAAGWNVTSIAVYEPETYGTDAVGKRDVPFPVSSPFRLFRGRKIPFVNDLLSGNYAAADDGGFPSIQRRLPERLDAIHVEQPWLWPLAQKLRAHKSGSRLVLIFGTQNIEAPLKRQILESYKITEVADLVAAIDARERQAAEETDLTLAVTRTDLEALRESGARNVLLAPNGVAPWQAGVELLNRWREKLPKAPWILYVASAHPPNFTGFASCLGDSLACIPPDSKLVVAGSVSEHIYKVMSDSRWRDLNLGRLQLLYSLADADLAAVKTLAHAFLLPISQGGGSNLKAAEALYSGLYVVGTPAAFRGFDAYTALPEVTVADGPRDMQAAIRRVLQSPCLPVGGRESVGNREALRWDRCLAAVPEMASRLLRQ
jgi:glycosyltransferase involved in cell wall biosynthesis